MEHDEVREILEDAAIEPGGLERLMAGDTPTASLVAGHLAGCPDCADELERLRRSVALIRPAVRDVPPPELRERTLAFVAAVGRRRGEDADTAVEAAPPSIRPAALPVTVRPDPVAPATPAATPVPFGRRRALGPLVGLAAALIVAVTGTAVLTNARRDGELRQATAQIDLQAAEIEALGDVARWTVRLDQQPDVRRIALAGAGGSGAPIGELTFSPTTTDLVVVADGLTPPPAGSEYRCWLERGGTRTAIGKMFFGGNVAYWVGPVPAVSGLGDRATFGVTLVDLAAPDAPRDPTLTGAG